MRSYELQEDVVPAFDGARDDLERPRARVLALRPPGRVDALLPRPRDRRRDGERLVERARRAHDAVQAVVPAEALDLRAHRPRLAAARAAAPLRRARRPVRACSRCRSTTASARRASHVRALRAAAGPPGGEPDPVFGYGALYHPWLYSSDPATPTAFRRTPPDGAAAGVIAARAFQRGAWIAPANEPLRDVVALDPAIRPRRATSSCRTRRSTSSARSPAASSGSPPTRSSEDESLRPIDVRRLLRLLRRAALLHGAVYVFEPNGDAAPPHRQARLREAPGARCSSAARSPGATPAESFQVNTGSPPNTPRVGRRTAG